MTRRDPIVFPRHMRPRYPLIRREDLPPDAVLEVEYRHGAPWCAEHQQIAPFHNGLPFCRSCQAEATAAPNAKPPTEAAWMTELSIRTAERDRLREEVRVMRGEWASAVERAKSGEHLRQEAQTEFAALRAEYSRVLAQAQAEAEDLRTENGRQREEIKHLHSELGKDEVALRLELRQAERRHREYADGIAAELGGVRLWRETGEPAQSDRAEVRRAVEGEKKVYAQRDELKAEVQEVNDCLTAAHREITRLAAEKFTARSRGFADAIEAAAKTGHQAAWEVTGHKGWADLIRDHIRALVPAAEPSEKFGELPVSPAPVETQGDALTELNAALDVLQDQGIAGRPWARTKAPEAGEILYRHYKGGLYRKLYNATLEATLEPVVVY